VWRDLAWWGSWVGLGYWEPTNHRCHRRHPGDDLVQSWRTPILNSMTQILKTLIRLSQKR
jgi:hypothetical protein